jgi:hypothetical protein
MCHKLTTIRWQQNNVAVKPERLLMDLPWGRLLEAGGSLEEEHRAAAQSEMDRLNTLHLQGMKIDPQTAVEVCPFHPSLL